MLMNPLVIIFIPLIRLIHVSTAIDKLINISAPLIYLVPIFIYLITTSIDHLLTEQELLMNSVMMAALQTEVL